VDVPFFNGLLAQSEPEGEGRMPIPVCIRLGLFLSH
jgi:hypothetical protein